MADTILALDAEAQEGAVSELFTQNMAAFREHAPQLYARLSQVRTPHSRLVVEDDGAIDIALGDRRFYGEDVVAYTQRQLDEYFAAPKRAYLSGAIRNLAGIEERVAKTLINDLGEEVDKLAETRIDQASHFTLVFGLGLGLHLAPLCEFTNCTQLIIVEPNFDNIYHSLYITDWRALYEQAATDGRTISFVLEKEQAVLASDLRRIIRLGNPSLLDGLYVYQHYFTSTLITARQAFSRDFKLHLSGLGFFEDELIMMANAAGNLKDGDARVLASAQPPRDEPVLICGSGPSIDSELNVIAAHADGAVVVSMGSSIRTLLAHGIRPDIHIETENHPLNAEGVERIVNEFGVDGITLLGAATVQPSVTEAFDDAILYFRDRQSPSEIFADGIDFMGSSGPSVANAALVTLLHLGFREIYLFGVDMGTRNADAYHSADTYIGRGETEEWARKDRVGVPANFGGDAATESILDWARVGMEGVLRLHPVVRCFNCSDGARIAGAIPKLPRMLDLADKPIARAKTVRDVIEKLPVYSKEYAEKTWENADFAAVAKDTYRRIDDVFARAEKNAEDETAWLDELYEMFDGDVSIPSSMPPFLLGTTVLFMGLFWWIDGRIKDDLVRRRFRRSAVRELRKVYDEMGQRVQRLASDVTNAIAGAPGAIDSSYDDGRATDDEKRTAWPPADFHIA